jgi:alkanesulfonate monooxygenase SsuD/methylene tetrahydromethanopterin reductase-like flavin-dependent oxidoreductase (luciferase family)
MKYGVVIFATDFAIRPDELGKAVEDRGFESLFFPEHTHIPASAERHTRWAVNFPRSTLIRSIR